MFQFLRGILHLASNFPPCNAVCPIKPCRQADPGMVQMDRAARCDSYGIDSVSGRASLGAGGALS
jgi:hypothetical protein